MILNELKDGGIPAYKRIWETRDYGCLRGQFKIYGGDMFCGQITDVQQALEFLEGMEADARAATLGNMQGG